ncbi:MAG: hypothetical protein ACRDJW_11085 [Thermomicrobiales bacterium]
MEPNNDHGDKRNITQAELERAAQASNITSEQAAQNIADCCRMMSDTQGMQHEMDASPGAPA